MEERRELYNNIESFGIKLGTGGKLLINKIIRDSPVEEGSDEFAIAWRIIKDMGYRNICFDEFIKRVKDYEKRFARYLYKRKTGKDL